MVSHPAHGFAFLAVCRRSSRSHRCRSPAARGARSKTGCAVAGWWGKGGRGGRGKGVLGNRETGRAWHAPGRRAGQTRATKSKKKKKKKKSFLLLALRAALRGCSGPLEALHLPGLYDVELLVANVHAAVHVPEPVHIDVLLLLALRRRPLLGPPGRVLPDVRVRLADAPDGEVDRRAHLFQLHPRDARARLFQLHRVDPKVHPPGPAVLGQRTRHHGDDMVQAPQVHRGNGLPAKEVQKERLDDFVRRVGVKGVAAKNQQGLHDIKRINCCFERITKGNFIPIPSKIAYPHVASDRNLPF
ncbi:MAG: hypothetical protein BJ554DRAFT_5427, partial [Olpidium bornovanus]